MNGPKKCPEGTVFVKGGYFCERKIPDLCVDQHEFRNVDGIRVKAQTSGSYQLVAVDKKGDTVKIIVSGKDISQLWAETAGKPPDLAAGIFSYSVKPTGKLPTSTSPKGFDRPEQPMVNVSGEQARSFCEAQGKRLLTPSEWSYVASQGGKKEFSTRDGKESKEGIHYGYAYGYPYVTTMDVCAKAGHYIEYGGKEICDMSGNAAEWAYDPYDSKYSYRSMGGSYNTENAVFSTKEIRADSCYGHRDEGKGKNGHYKEPSVRSDKCITYAGFRCASEPESKPPAAKAKGAIAKISKASEPPDPLAKFPKTKALLAEMERSKNPDVKDAMDYALSASKRRSDEFIVGKIKEHFMGHK